MWRADLPYLSGSRIDPGSVASHRQAVADHREYAVDDAEAAEVLKDVAGELPVPFGLRHSRELRRQFRDRVLLVEEPVLHRGLQRQRPAALRQRLCRGTILT